MDVASCSPLSDCVSPSTASPTQCQTCDYQVLNYLGVVEAQAKLAAVVGVCCIIAFFNSRTVGGLACSLFPRGKSEGTRGPPAN
jgi:hypothetical protein